MHLNAIWVQVFFYHVDVEKCYFVYQNLVEIVLSPPHYIIKPLCNDGRPLPWRELSKLKTLFNLSRHSFYNSDGNSLLRGQNMWKKNFRIGKKSFVLFGKKIPMTLMKVLESINWKGGHVRKSRKSFFRTKKIWNQY